MLKLMYMSLNCPSPVGICNFFIVRLSGSDGCLAIRVPIVSFTFSISLSPFLCVKKVNSILFFQIPAIGAVTIIFICLKHGKNS